MGVFCGVTAELVLAALSSDRFMAPYLQFVARNHPAFVTLLLALVLLAGERMPGLAARWMAPASFGVLAVLALGASSWHLAATRDWAAYILRFRELLATNRGRALACRVRNLSRQRHS